jgi:ribosomal protein L29
MDPLLKNLGAILTLLGVLGAAYLTYRASNRKLTTDSTQQIVDQLQEEVAGLRKELAELRRTQRIQGDYVGELRRHIADGQPPPPPAWPLGLIT